jgi:hypothetical protein
MLKHAKTSQISLLHTVPRNEGEGLSRLAGGLILGPRLRWTRIVVLGALQHRDQGSLLVVSLLPPHVTDGPLELWLPSVKTP